MTETATDSVTRTYNTGDASETDVSQTVVMAVADAKGVDPLDLDPLYTAVDPDALNKMFRPVTGHASSEMNLSFSMADCQVDVHGDGDVVVTPQAARDERKAVVASHGD